MHSAAIRPHGFRGLSCTLALILAALVRPASAPALEATQAPDFLPRISSHEEFDTVAVPASSPNADRVAKYIVPARDDAALLGPMFQNAHVYRFHFEFLASVFPDRFPGLGMAEYLDLVERRASRDYHAGTVTRFYVPGRAVYGFTVFTDGADPAEMLDAAEVLAVYKRLKAAFPLESLEYAPVRPAEVARARSWTSPGFPVFLDGAGEDAGVIGYTAATNFGRVRGMTLAQLRKAEEAATIGFQDLIVLDEAPDDILIAVGGVVTAAPQGELSHLSVRLATRGVPNAYVRNARQAFAALEGALVRLEVRADSYDVRAATVEEAEAWWTAHRPSLPPIPEADGSHAALDRLTEIDATSLDSRAVARFGGKAAGLARLYSFLPARYQTAGFAIPFRGYLEFIRLNRRPSLAAPGVDVTYEEFIREMLADPRFRSDGAFRRQTLEDFRERGEESGVLPAGLSEEVGQRIVEVFGGPGVEVRFRSSSNAEDSIEFGGAGLYESTSVCVLDDRDQDDEGPSLCDPTKGKERTVARGLRRVWMSLWKFEAFEEREYFQIDHEQAAMAVLVTRAFPAEDSNGVAFTGNPSNRVDRSYIVNAQLGDVDVVSPEPGIQSEKDILVMDGGKVGRILRARASSIVVPGQYVLEDTQLEELGEVLALVAAEFPRGLDTGGHPAEDVLVDVELKFQDGQLILKQARPFLIKDPAPRGLVFRFEVPGPVTACGLWEEFRHPDDEYRLKSRIELRVGSVDLPLRAGAVLGRIIERFELGPERRVLEPLDSGLFQAVRAPDRVLPGEVWYPWRFEQRFADGEDVISVSIDSLNFRIQNGEPVDPVFELTEEVLSQERFLSGVILDTAGEVKNYLRFGSCTYESLPLWEISVDFGDGDRALFHERYQVPFAGSGPANVLRCEAWLDGVRHVETSYWRLVYAADHHNWNEEFRMIFSPPITVGGLAGVGALHVQEGFDEIRRGAALLDEEFKVIRDLTVVSYSKVEVPGSIPGTFRRGDANGDGRVDLSDAVFVLRWLFSGGEAPGCPDAADADDSGKIEITDPIAILQHLFSGVSPPAMRLPGCGLDENQDALEECTTLPAGC
ncbi:MAG TPA: PEP/pyruvate-binding domain-containing protein [Planctomycetota bacterium]|nr:PEP/pyruvate-binding domain-containing protein [Planctomycetota bacterium]